RGTDHGVPIEACGCRTNPGFFSANCDTILYFDVANPTVVTRTASVTTTEWFEPVTDENGEAHTYAVDWDQFVAEHPELADRPLPPVICPSTAQCGGGSINGVAGQEICTADGWRWTCTNRGWRPLDQPCTCATCGDGACSAGETCASCPADCGPCCTGACAGE